MGKVITAVFGRSVHHAYDPPGEVTAASALANQVDELIRPFKGGQRPPVSANDTRATFLTREPGESHAGFAMRAAVHLCQERIALVRRAESLWNGTGEHACGDFADMSLAIAYENILCEQSSRPSRPDIMMAALERSGTAIQTLRAFQRGLHEAGRRCSIEALRPLH